MVSTSSQDNSFICVENICDAHCQERNIVATAHPVKKYLRDLLLNIRLFFEMDKWEPTVTLKVGDSYYTMKMEDIESRWRNP
jgi:hypothetical protein